MKPAERLRIARKIKETLYTSPTADNTSAVGIPAPVKMFMPPKAESQKYNTPYARYISKMAETTPKVDLPSAYYIPQNAQITSTPWYQNKTATEAEVKGSVRDTKTGPFGFIKNPNDIAEHFKKTTGEEIVTPENINRVVKAMEDVSKSEGGDPYWKNVFSTPEEKKNDFTFEFPKEKIPEVKLGGNAATDLLEPIANVLPKSFLNEKIVSEERQKYIEENKDKVPGLLAPEWWTEIKDPELSNLTLKGQRAIEYKTEKDIENVTLPLKKEIKSIDSEINKLDAMIASSTETTGMDTSEWETQRENLQKQKAEKNSELQLIKQIEKVAMLGEMQALVDADEMSWKFIVDGQRIGGNNAYLTEDEKRIYYYLLGKYGESSAQKILDLLDDELRYRAAAYKYNNYDPVEKGAAVFFGSAANAIAGIWGGIKQFFSDEPVEKWEITDTAAYIQEKGGFGYDLLGLLGNMAPAVAASFLGSTFTGLFGGFGSATSAASTASTVGKIAGGATTYLSASGNAYHQKIKQGYSPTEAKIYSNFVGASEGALQYLLGGISRLGKGNVGLIAQKIVSIENAFTRAAAELAHRGFKEISEELLQEFIEPAISSLVFDESYDAPTMEELLYTALLSFATTGVFEVPEITGDIRAERKTDTEVGSWLRSENADADGEITRSVIEEGLESAPGTQANSYAEMLQKRTEKGKDISDRQLGHMYRENVDAIHSENKTASETETASEITKSPGYMVDTSPAPLLRVEEIADYDSVEAPKKYNVFNPEGIKINNELEKRTIESAVNIGMNNTRDTHFLVETAAKISSESGIPITFTTGAVLNQMGYNLEGREIGGVYTPQGILINAESSRAGQTILGHELVHWLQQNGLYNTYNEAITSYAKEIGVYDATRTSTSDLYKNKADADIDLETTADLTGTYLFTDEAFVSRLAEHRNLFQRIYDKIRHYYNFATAGSPEARLLERAKYTFEKAYRKQSGKTINDDGVKYELRKKDVLEMNIPWDSNNYSTLKEQLQDHVEEVNTMEPVIKVIYSSKDKVPYFKVLENDLKNKFGNRIDIPNFGTVFFDNEAVSDITSHGISTDADKAAVISTPYVLKRGKIISGHKNHKEQGTVSVTLAAPVILNEQRVNVAVCIKFSKGRVHSVRVLTPDNKNVELLKTKDTKSRTEKFGLSASRSTNTTENLHINSVSNNMIAQPLPEVNSDFLLISKESQQAGEKSGVLETKLPTDDEVRASVNNDLSSESRIKEEKEITDTGADSDNSFNVDNAPTSKSFGNFSEMGRKQIATRPYDSTDAISTRPIMSVSGIKEKIWDGFNALDSKIVDSGRGVSVIGKITGDKQLYAFYNMARSSQNIAAYMVLTASTDVNGNKTGKGLVDIFSPIFAEGEEYYRKFQEYLYHRHNIDRMSLKASDANIATVKGAFFDYKKAHPELTGNYTDSEIYKIALNPEHELQGVANQYIELLELANEVSSRKNKPVFGEDSHGKIPDAAESKAISDNLLKEYPEFSEYAEDVYSYIDNLMQYRVDSGLITQEQRAMLQKLYPHYVPTFRVTSKKNKEETQKNKKKSEVKSTIGRATGGASTLMPIDQALIRLTAQVVGEGTKNRFGTRLLDDVLKYSGENYENSAVSKYVTKEPSSEKYFSAANYYDRHDSKDEHTMTNTFVVYKDGKRWQMNTNKLLYEAVNALDVASMEELNFLAKTNDVFKKLITEYNPAFLVRNGIKDIQEAIFNSKSSTSLLKAYPEAIKQISSNGDYWQTYLALGGLNASIYDSPGLPEVNKEIKSDIENGIYGSESLSDNLFERYSNLNRIIEQLPRFAEFMSTVKKHGGLENASSEVLAEAMYNAAEVTTNFGRSGQWTKALNKYAVPFLNPAVQGASKAIRNVVETRGFKNWAKLVSKWVIYGFVTSKLINDLIHDDDEDYEALSDETKANYYLFKYADGKFIKIPKGRYISAINYTAQQFINAAKGEGVDAGKTINHAWNQIGIANPLTNNFIMPIFKTAILDDENPGETWYESDIESERLQGLPVEERYDARTDELSKTIGKWFGVSPKKINYLFNQYGGVLADVFLPMMTPAAENNMFEASFTINSDLSNKYSEEYYESKKEAEYSANSIKATPYDKIVQKYWGNQNKGITEVNKVIRELEADESLSDSEKKELLQVQYKIRTGLYKTSLDSSEKFSSLSKKYYDKAPYADEEDKIAYSFAMSNRDVFGAEYALSSINKEAYEEAVSLNEKGISYDEYFDAYIEYDKIKKSTEDAKKRKTEFARYVYKLDVEDSKKKVIREALIGEGETDYEKFINAGISDESAYKIGIACNELKPEKKYGNKSVKTYQKLQVVRNLDLTNKEKALAMATLSSDSQAEKIKRLSGLGINLNLYADLAELIGHAGKSISSVSNSELEMWINRLSPPSLGLGGLTWPQIKNTLYGVLASDVYKNEKTTDNDVTKRLRTAKSVYESRKK